MGGDRTHTISLSLSIYIYPTCANSHDHRIRRRRRRLSSSLDNMSGGGGYHEAMLPPPLFVTKQLKGRFAYRCFASTIFAGICLIFVYRLKHLPSSEEDGRSWACLGLFMAELWFAFYWIITQSVRWNVLHRLPFKDRLFQRFDHFFIFRLLSLFRICFVTVCYGVCEFICIWKNLRGAYNSL